MTIQYQGYSSPEFQKIIDQLIKLEGTNFTLLVREKSLGLMSLSKDQISSERHTVVNNDSVK